MAETKKRSNSVPDTPTRDPRKRRILSVNQTLSTTGTTAATGVTGSVADQAGALSWSTSNFPDTLNGQVIATPPNNTTSDPITPSSILKCDDQVEDGLSSGRINRCRPQDYVSLKDNLQEVQLQLKRSEKKIKEMKRVHEQRTPRLREHERRAAEYEKAGREREVALETTRKHARACELAKQEAERKVRDQETALFTARRDLRSQIEINADLRQQSQQAGEVPCQRASPARNDPDFEQLKASLNGKNVVIRNQDEEVKKLRESRKNLSVERDQLRANLKGAMAQLQEEQDAHKRTKNELLRCKALVKDRDRDVMAFRDQVHAMAKDHKDRTDAMLDVIKLRTLSEGLLPEDV